MAETLARVIQRADELAEFVAIYWKDGRVPLSAQVKKGLAAAFGKFDEYALAKYDRAGPVKLRDVLFLCSRQAAGRGAGRAVEAAGRGRAGDARHLGGCTLRRRRQARGLGASARERKLGALALLRNLRNMQQAGVDEELVYAALAHEDGARAAVPLPRGGASCSAVGAGTGIGDVPFGRRPQAKLRARRCCWWTSPAP